MPETGNPINNPGQKAIKEGATMSTKKNNTGASNIHPNRVPAGTGSEVTGTPPAVVPVVPVVPTAPAADPTAEITASQLYLTEAGIKGFRDDLSKALTKLYTFLRVFPSPDKGKVPAVSAPHKEAAGLYAGLLRRYPTLTTAVDPDVIDGGIAVDAALAMVKADFDRALPMVAYAGRQAANISWTDTVKVRFAAKGQARGDKVLAAEIVAIDAGLRQGKRVLASANKAAKAQTAATKAQEQAAKAAAKATKAARVATRTAQAHADNHPTTPDVVIVPAGTTPKP